MTDAPGNADQPAAVQYVGRAMAGEIGDVLEALYRRHFHEVCRYVSRRFGAGPPTPEDVAQQAFLKLAANGGADSVRSPRAFLFQSARNVVIDEHRKAATRRGLIVEPADDFHETCDDLHPERVLSARERLAIVREAILAMPAPRRRSFLMHRLRGLSFAEIARQTGYSASGVKKHVTLALEDIERAVDEAEGVASSGWEAGR